MFIIVYIVYYKDSFIKLMSKTKYTDEQISEMTEDAFVNIKEACMRLQERTKCGNDV